MALGVHHHPRSGFVRQAMTRALTPRHLDSTCRCAEPTALGGVVAYWERARRIVASLDQCCFGCRSLAAWMVRGSCRSRCPLRARAAHRFGARHLPRGRISRVVTDVSDHRVLGSRGARARIFFAVPMPLASVEGGMSSMLRDPVMRSKSGQPLRTLASLAALAAASCLRSADPSRRA